MRPIVIFYNHPFCSTDKASVFQLSFFEQQHPNNHQYYEITLCTLIKFLISFKLTHCETVHDSTVRSLFVTLQEQQLMMHPQ